MSSGLALGFRVAPRLTLSRVLRLGLRLVAVLGLATVATETRPAAGSEEPRGVGISVLASDVGNGYAVPDLLACIDAAKVTDVIVDWAWITYHWDVTNFEQVNVFVAALERRNVRVAAMYRPRFYAHEREEIGVPYQVDAAGGLRGTGCEILYADPAARAWATEWATRILRRCPALREVVVYNPTQGCQSAVARAARGLDPEYDIRSVHTFLKETRRAMRGVREDARLGLVLAPDPAVYVRYHDTIDVARPFLFVTDRADFARDVERARAVQLAAPNAGPALAKITWGPGERVSDARLATFVRTAREGQVPFCLWTFHRAFLDGVYDVAALCAALGIDFDALAPALHRLAREPEAADVERAVRAAASTPPAMDHPTMLATARRCGESAVATLGALLDDRAESEGVRWRAAAALGTIATESSVDALLRGSRDESAVVRWSCAMALGFAADGSARVVRRLREMAESDPVASRGASGEGDVFLVRDAATKALDTLLARGLVDEPFLGDRVFEATIERGLARARRERRHLVLLVNPFDGQHLQAGWEGAAELAAETPGSVGNSAATDVGLLKERAMVVGLFAEPRIVSFVRDRCVLVKIRLDYRYFSRKLSAGLPNPLAPVGLVPLELGAPAVVVCSPRGEVVAQASHLAFFCPELTAAILRAGLPSAGARGGLLPAPRGVLDRAEADLLAGRAADARHALERVPPDRRAPWRRAALLAEAAFRTRDPGAALAEWERMRPVARDEEGDSAARAEFFAALALDALGRADEARAHFVALALTGDRGPWSARAALYVATRGPNPREWCPFGELPLPTVIHSTEKAPNVGGPAPDTGAGPAIGRATAYLLDRQRPDGSWEGAHAPEAADSVAVARAALAVCALDEALPRLPAADRAQAESALRRGREFVERAVTSADQRLWSATYALHMELRFFERREPAARPSATTRVRRLVRTLMAQEEDGGWTYRPGRPQTFNTALVATALADVRRLGLADVDETLDRATAFLEGQRIPGTAIFKYADRMQIAPDTADASMRSALCESALAAAGRGDPGRLREAVELCVRHLDDVRSTAKEWESFMDPAVMADSYRFYFGTMYAARAVGGIADVGARAELAGRLSDAVLATEELDGGYVDSQVSSGRVAATAMALMTLAACERARE